MTTKRQILKKVAGVSAIAAFAPSSWTKPVINSVIVPAHAQTSIASSSSPTILAAVDDTRTTAIGAPPVILDILANDSAPNGATLSIVSVSFVSSTANNFTLTAPVPAPTTTAGVNSTINFNANNGAIPVAGVYTFSITAGNQFSFQVTGSGDGIITFDYVITDGINTANAQIFIDAGRF